MDKTTFNEILKLNTKFYESVQQDFDISRQFFWPGWIRVGEYAKKLSKSSKIKVGDLGCGNGRFYKFLSQTCTENNFEYIGFDTNIYLLETAQKKWPNVTFKYTDVITHLDLLPNDFDLILATGITHHIPSKDFRAMWFKQLADKLTPGGFLVLTFWHFDKTKVFEPLPKELSVLSLETNDYFIKWMTDVTIPRYTHFFDYQEIKEIIESLSEKDLHLAENFDSDGKDDKTNTYLIFRKAI